MDLAYIPSPSTGVIHLGPVPLRGYAFCIIIGVFVGIWIGSKQWRARGGQPGTVADIAIWAVPFGLVGGRLYHVITTYELYFGEGKNWIDAFKVWEGGLGIWGRSRWARSAPGSAAAATGSHSPPTPTRSPPAS